MEKIEKNNNLEFKSNIKNYLLTMAIIAALSGQPESFANEKNNLYSIKQTETGILKNKEKNDEIWSYEVIFKDGIRKALHGLNNILQIPKWWKIIEYFRDDEHASLAGKKMSQQAVKSMNLPESFDISPKEFSWSISSMNFHLGDRTFNIEPWIGKIQNIKLNSIELIIETTWKNIVYDKDGELPRLMFKLWKTPKGKWKKEWFKGSTVKEI